MLLIATASKAGTFTNKNIGTLHLPDDRPCTFFKLEGVDASDPSTPSIPWFAIRQSKTGYKETVAAVIGAKLSSKPLTVLTSGAFAPECSGIAEVLIVEIP